MGKCLCPRGIKGLGIQNAYKCPGRATSRLYHSLAHSVLSTEYKDISGLYFSCYIVFSSTNQWGKEGGWGGGINAGQLCQLRCS